MKMTDLATKSQKNKKPIRAKMKTETRLLIILLLFILNLPYSIAQVKSQDGLPEGAIARFGKGGINVMRFSPDGAYLVVGTDVGLWIYDVSDQTERALFTEYPSQVNVLAFSDDGSLVACGGTKNIVIRLWELRTGNERSSIHLPHLNDDMNSIRGISFLPEKNKVAILDRLGMLVHWEIEKRTAEIIKRDIDTNISVIFHKKRNFMVTEDSDGKIRFWDMITGEPWLSDIGNDGFLEKDRQNIGTMAISPNSRILACVNRIGTVLLWNTQERTKIATIKGHTSKVTALAFSEDNKLLASGDSRFSIKLWDLETQSEMFEQKGHTSGICALAFSPEGKILASGSSDGTIVFWNPGSGEKISTFATGHTEHIKTMAFSKNDTTLTSADFNGKVEIWSLNSKQTLSKLDFAPNGIMEAVAFSQDAKFYATQENRWNFALNPLNSAYSASRNQTHLGPNEKPIEIWDLTKHKKIDTLTKEKMRDVDSLLFSPDGNILVAGFEQQGIFSWDIDTGDKIFQVDIKEPTTRKLAFDPKGKLLATGGRSFKTQVWNIDTGEELILPILPFSQSIAFSNDGSLVAIGHFKEISLWYVTPDGLEEGDTFADVRVGENLVFSLDDKTLVFSLPFPDQNRIRLIDVNTQNEIKVLNGHTEAITRLVFSHDGLTLASGSKDGTILLWDWEKVINKE